MPEGREELSAGSEEATGALGVTEGASDAPDSGGLDSDDLSGLSTREVAELAYAEEKAKLASAGSENQEGQQKAQPGAAKPAQGPRPEAQGIAQEAPPTRLNTAQKELFNQLPPQLKIGVAQMFRDHDRQFHNTQQQYARATQEATAFTGNVIGYLQQRPHLIEAGYTAPAFVNALLGFHAQLENPKTRDAKFAAIGRDIELSPERFVAIGQALGFGHVFGQAANQDRMPPDISSHPTFQTLVQKINSLEQQNTALQTKLNPVYSAYEGQIQTQHSAAVTQNISEAQAIREERDASGRYLHPEMHGDQNGWNGAFLDQAQPLVDALRKAIPGLPFGEALKRAYHTIKGSYPAGNFTSAVPAKLPAQTNTLQRATRAAITARGGVAPSGASQMDSFDECPPEVRRQGTYAITKWAAERIKAGAAA